MLTGKPSNNKENPDWIPSVFNFPSSLGGKSDSSRLKAVERAERAAQKKSSKREQQLDAGQLSSHAANENVLQVSTYLLNDVPIMFLSRIFLSFTCVLNLYSVHTLHTEPKLAESGSCWQHYKS